MECGICGGTIFIKAGTKIDRAGTWQILQCKKCGHKQKEKLLKESIIARGGT